MYVEQKYAVGAAVVVLLCAIAFAQNVSDQHIPTTPLQPLQPLPAPVLASATLGLRSAAASFLWLQVIQHVGGSGGGLDGVGEALEQVVALDPTFSYPYAFAVLLLPGTSAEATQQAIMLGKKGVEQNLGDWRVPYYLASTYHLTLGDTKNAAFYMDIAANTPGVPEGIKLSAHNYGLRSDIREETKQIWISIYENSADDVVRAQAQKNIEHISIIQLLERAILAYKNMYGVHPSTLEELVAARVLPNVPVDPFGIRYSISPEGTLGYEL